MSVNIGKKTNIVIQYLEQQLANGSLRPGDKLMTEQTLMDKLDVSRVTVRRALEAMADQGRVEHVRGRGCFVKAEQKTSRPGTIPFILAHDDTLSRVLDIYKGAQDYLKARDCQVILAVSHYDIAYECQQVLDFFKKGHRFMIVLSNSGSDSMDFYFDLMQKGASFVFVDKKPQDLPCDFIRSDNFTGGFLAARHLIEQGHRRIAVCSHEMPHQSLSIADRIAGYRFALKKYGVPFREDSLHFAYGVGIEAMTESLLRQDEMPTALFCLNDIIAMHTYNALVNRGIRIPEQMSIIGFDNLSITADHVPSLSTIGQDFYGMGYRAAKVIYHRIQAQKQPFFDCALPVELIVRDSSQPPASR